MRGLFTILCLANTINCYAAYDWYFTNNTSESLNFVTNLVKNSNCQNLSSEFFQTYHGVSAPYSRVKLATINYNEGMRPEAIYCFTSALTNNNIKLNINTQIQGSTIGSKIIASQLQFNEHEHPLFTRPPLPSAVSDNSAFVELIQLKNLESYNFYAAATKPSLEPSLQSVNDLYFVLEQPTVQLHYQESPTSLTIMTYNTQLLPEYAQANNIRLNHLNTRANAIPPLINNYDVVIAEELFDANARADFIQGMQAAYPYHYGPINNDDPAKLSGGTMIFSRYPITTQRSHHYQACNGVDCRALKGVLYVTINKHDKPYHIFATHTQADDNAGELARDQAARLQQFQELKDFIQQQEIAANEVLIVAGDFNIDSHRCLIQHNCEEYNKTIGSLSPVPPQWDNANLLPYASDPRLNLMNTDGEAASYDYILSLPGHPQPLTQKSLMVAPRLANQNVMYGRSSYNITIPAPYAVLDLSDHFAYSSQFTFAK